MQVLEAPGPWQQGLSGLLGSEDSIKVIPKLRPSTTPGFDFAQYAGHKALALGVGPESSRWEFDFVASPHISQRSFFKVAGKPMADHCLSFYNSAILAYGQTGSGKTHTMLGKLPHKGGPMPKEAGLVPRILAYMFDQIPASQLAPDTTTWHLSEPRRCLMRISMVQIYNEVITDLLNPKSGKLPVRETIKDGVNVVGVSEIQVQNVHEALALLRIGMRNRTVAETANNPVSSRSHCILTLHIEAREEHGPGLATVRRSKFNMVDLAGSERSSKDSASRGGPGAERQRETNAINRSLTNLGLVILRLIEPGTGPVPYRDSKLTHLLQDSLGGNARTLLIANINPSGTCMNETNMTLGFAVRARKVRNLAVVNVDHVGDAMTLQMENERLRKELAMYRSMHEADGVQSAPRMLSPPPFPNLADQPAGQQAGYPAAPVHQARDDVSSGTAAPKHAGAAGAGTAAGGGSTVVAGLELSRALQKQLEALQSAHARLQAEHCVLQEQCRSQSGEMAAMESTVEQCEHELQQLREAHAAALQQQQSAYRGSRLAHASTSPPSQLRLDAVPLLPDMLAVPPTKCEASTSPLSSAREPHIMTLALAHSSPPRVVRPAAPDNDNDNGNDEDDDDLQLAMPPVSPGVISVAAASRGTSSSSASLQHELLQQEQELPGSDGGGVGSRLSEAPAAAPLTGGPRDDDAPSPLLLQEFSCQSNPTFVDDGDDGGCGCGEEVTGGLAGAAGGKQMGGNAPEQFSAQQQFRINPIAEDLAYEDDDEDGDGDENMQPLMQVVGGAVPADHSLHGMQPPGSTMSGVQLASSLQPASANKPYYIGAGKESQSQSQAGHAGAGARSVLGNRSPQLRKATSLTLPDEPLPLSPLRDRLLPAAGTAAASNSAATTPKPDGLIFGPAATPASRMPLTFIATAHVGADAAPTSTTSKAVNVGSARPIIARVTPYSGMAGKVLAGHMSARSTPSHPPRLWLPSPAGGASATPGSSPGLAWQRRGFSGSGAEADDDGGASASGSLLGEEVQLVAELQARLAVEAGLRAQLQEAAQAERAAQAQVGSLLELNSGLIEELAARDDRVRGLEQALTHLLEGLQDLCLQAGIVHPGGDRARGDSCMAAECGETPASGVCLPMSTTKSGKAGRPGAYDSTCTPGECTTPKAAAGVTPSAAAAGDAVAASPLSPISSLLGYVDLTGANDIESAGLTHLLRRLSSHLAEQQMARQAAEAQARQAQAHLARLEELLLPPSPVPAAGGQGHGDANKPSSSVGKVSASTSASSLDAAVQGLQSRLRELEAQLAKQVQAHAAALQAQEVAQAQTASHQAQAHAAELRSQARAHADEVAQLHQQLEAVRAETEQQHADLTARMQQQADSWQARMRQQAANHASEAEKVKQIAAADAQRAQHELASAHRAQVQALQHAHDSQMQHLKAAHASELQRLASMHDGELQRSRSMHGLEMQRASQQLARVQQELAAREQQCYALQAAAQHHEAQCWAAVQQLQQLQREHEQVKAALVDAKMRATSQWEAAQASAAEVRHLHEALQARGEELAGVQAALRGVQAQLAAQAEEMEALKPLRPIMQAWKAPVKALTASQAAAGSSAGGKASAARPPLPDPGGRMAVTPQRKVPGLGQRGGVIGLDGALRGKKHRGTHSSLKRRCKEKHNFDCKGTWVMRFLNARGQQQAAGGPMSPGPGGVGVGGGLGMHALLISPARSGGSVSFLVKRLGPV